MQLSALAEALDNFVAKAPRDPEWRQIHRIADKAVPAIESLFLSSLLRLKNGMNTAKLAEAYKTGLVTEVENAIPWERFDIKFAEIQEILFNLVVGGGEVASLEFLRNFGQKFGIVKKAEADELQFSFNMRNPKAIKWAQDQSATLIRQVGTETKDAVRMLVSNAFEKGGHPFEVARKIRQHIGLTEYQMKNVLNYQARLDETGRPQKRVDEMVDSYVRKQVRERAKTIARTETINSACAGQQTHWEDMANKGFLDKETTRKEWIITPDDRLCDLCLALEGEKVPIDGVFSWGGAHPTRHPRCRCGTGLAEIEAPEGMKKRGGG